MSAKQRKAMQAAQAAEKFRTGFETERCGEDSSIQ